MPVKRKPRHVQPERLLLRRENHGKLFSILDWYHLSVSEKATYSKTAAHLLKRGLMRSKGVKMMLGQKLNAGRPDP